MGRLRFWLRWSLRDLRQRWLLVLTLALVVALATGVSAGLGSMETWRLRSNDASFARLHMHDLRVSLAAEGSVRAGALAAAATAIPHSRLIAGTQERLIIPTQVDVAVPGGGVLVPGKIVGVPLAGAGSAIDSRFAQKGRDLRPSDAGNAVAVVEGNFGDYHGLPIPVDARIAGGRRLRLVGQVLQPEQFLVTRPGADFGAESGYAVLYTSLATAQSLGGRTGQVNELVLALRPHADPALVEAELRRTFAERLPAVGVTFTRRADEDVHRILYDDARSDQQMVDIFAWLLLAGAAFASFNLVTRVVESQRREVGIGMALGVSPARLAIRPLLFAAEISLLGVVAGIGIGLAFNQIFRGSLQELLALPIWTTPLLPGVYARAAALGLAVPLLAAAYPVARAVRVRPVDAIRIGSLTAGGAGLAPLLERLRLPGSSLAKMPVRNLARTPRRTLTSLLGIAAVITILVALAGVFDSFNRALAASHDEALHGNRQRMTATLATIVPSTGPTVRAIVDSPAVAAAEPTLVLPVTLRSGNTAFDAMLQALDPANAVWRPRITSGEFTSGGGIVLAGQAAEDLGLHVGDRVTIAHPVRTGPTTFRTATSEVEIVALHGNPLRGLAYMSSRQAGRFGLAGATNTVELRPRGTPEALTRALLAIPGVASVESGSAVPDAMRSYMDEFLAILRITQTVTLLLAVLIAFNTMSIATEERRREHATMLAFGVRPRSILRNAVVESALIGTLGTIVGLAFGLAMLGWIVNVTSADIYPELGIPVSLSPASVATAAAVGIVAVGLSPLLGARRLRRTNIPATLRVVE
ncbi:MAG: ABC transporter permease [Pseudomonadota bacterium]